MRAVLKEDRKLDKKHFKPAKAGLGGINGLSLARVVFNWAKKKTNQLRLVSDLCVFGLLI